MALVKSCIELLALPRLAPRSIPAAAAEFSPPSSDSGVPLSRYESFSASDISGSEKIFSCILSGVPNTRSPAMVPLLSLMVSGSLIASNLMLGLVSRPSNRTSPLRIIRLCPKERKRPWVILILPWASMALLSLRVLLTTSFPTRPPLNPKPFTEIIGPTETLMS